MDLGIVMGVIALVGVTCFVILLAKGVISPIGGAALFTLLLAFILMGFCLVPFFMISCFAPTTDINTNSHTETIRADEQMTVTYERGTDGSIEHGLVICKLNDRQTYVTPYSMTEVVTTKDDCRIEEEYIDRKIRRGWDLLYLCSDEQTKTRVKIYTANEATPGKRTPAF